MEKLKIVLTFCNSGAYCASNPSIKGYLLNDGGPACIRMSIYAYTVIIIP